MRGQVLFYALLFFNLLLLPQSALSQTNIQSENQELIFEHYKTERGLSSSIVNCVIQDRIGFLWFGTYSGLDRFDGLNFKSFQHIPGDTLSIINGSVKCLREDNEGNIWIGTNNGLDKYIRSTETFIHYELPDFSSGSLINALAEDKNGFIWIGTSAGLYRFNPSINSFSHFTNKKYDSASIIDDNVRSILVDKNDNLWIGTSLGLDKFERKTESFIHYWQNPNPKKVYSTLGTVDKYLVTTLFEDWSGIIWIGTQDGLLKFNPANNEFYLYQNNPEDENTLSFHAVNAICQENENELWIGTSVGLNLFNKSTGKFTRFFYSDNITSGLSQNAISALLMERSGTFWVTTSSGGINRADRPIYNFQKYDYKPWRKTNRFASSSILNMDVSNKGTIWLGTPTGLVNFDPINEIFKVFNFNKNIRTVKEDKRGNLWIGINISSGRGFVRLDNNFNEIAVTDSAGNKLRWLINDITIYDDSTLIACTVDSGSILKINTNSNKFSVLYKSNDYFYTLHKDVSGLIWAGTRDNGVICFDPSTQKITDHFISEIKNDKSITGNSVMTIFEDALNNLWMGTNVGLNKFDRAKNEFYHFTEKDGLPYNRVDLIFTDSKNNLWLITVKGLSKFNPSTGEIKNYDVLPGLIGPDWQGIGCQLDNGEIYFDSPGGITRLHPDSIQDNQFIPPIVITNISVLDSTIYLRDGITLSHDNNNISLEFASLSYIRPERNLYAYKLEGFDNEWNYVGTKRNASYTNLDPGTYVFRVKGSNNDGIWNETGASLKLIILPPWWQTTWAYVIYILLISSIIYTIWKTQLKRIKIKHEYEMSKFETQKLHEIDEIKNRFFTNISHEFRTPLTLILGPVKQIIGRIKDERTKEELSIVHRNANKLLDLVNQLLEISKLESGSMKLLTIPQNAVPLVKALTMSFTSYAERKNILLNFNTSNDEIFAYLDNEKVEKIITNILSNAFKFTPEEGQIDVFTNKAQNDLVISISDNGIGIPDDKIANIFDRFYQVDGSHTREQEGTGIGLSLTKELVELHRGKINIQSEEGKGTVVTISFPLGKEYLEPGEICTDEIIVKNIINTTFHSKQADESFTGSFSGDIVSSELEMLSQSEKPLLLIVEDNSDVRKYVKDNLLKNYRILEAVDGEDGWNKTVEELPDLIISDIMMPGIDGFKLCEKIKTDERTSHIPVILLTAKAAKEDKLTGYDTGADEYMMKPFDHEELRARIKNLIEQRKRLHEHFQKKGIYEVDNARITSTDKIFLQRVFTTIIQNMSDTSFNVEALTEKLGISRAVLYKKIHALSGDSPLDLIRKIRLKKATELFDKKFGNISEVALEVGFNNPAYFSECFRKQFGISPTQYQQKTTIVNK